MGRKPKIKKEHKLEMPFYCDDYGKCKTASEANENLKIVHNMGWTHDILCKRQNLIVYGL